MAHVTAILKGVEDLAWMSVMVTGTTNDAVPKVLKSTVALGVFDILAEEKVEMSGREIVESMKAKNSFSISNPKVNESMDRLLRVLATCGLLSASTMQEEGAEGQGGKVKIVQKYGLNAMSWYLASKEQGGPSFAIMPLLGQHKRIQKAFQNLERSVLDGGCPFFLDHGPNATLFSDVDHDFAKLFNSCMDNHSRLFMPFILSNYDGFQEARTLIDVGGGNGASIASIVSKYPHIRGINFDQPHVVASAPSYPSVTHIGGDMFESIPQADTIFMKWILHDWSDECCVRILKNCFNSLPKYGKVIIVDSMQDLAVGTTLKDRLNSCSDLLMFALTDGGKERCKHEFCDIATAAGFGDIHVVMRIHEFHVMELRKG